MFHFLMALKLCWTGFIWYKDSLEKKINGTALLEPGNETFYSRLIRLNTAALHTAGYVR